MNYYILGRSCTFFQVIISIKIDGFQLLYNTLAAVESWDTCGIPRSNVATYLDNMITIVGRQRLSRRQQDFRDVFTMECIKSMADQARLDPDIHIYHKKQALEKIKEIKDTLQYFQKARHDKTPRARLLADQLNILNFFSPYQDVSPRPFIINIYI